MNEFSELDDGDGFPNAYARASQARMSGHNRRSFHNGSTSTAAPCANAGTSLKCDQDQSADVKPDQKVIANLEPVKGKAELASPSRRLLEAVANQRLMTANEVAAYLRVSVSKVWRLSKGAVNFPVPVRIGGSTRWERQAIDHYLDGLQPPKLLGH